MRICLTSIVAFILMMADNSPNVQVNASARTCTNLFQCMPYLLVVPFKDIVNMTYYYTGSWMKWSEISDEDWNRQMDVLAGLCDTWLTFDSCMDRDWVECIDWDQLTALVELVGQTGDRATNGNTTVNSQLRAKGLNKTVESLSDVHWTLNDTKRSMKIGSHLCKHINDFIPNLSCMRDLMLSNETIINITLWYTDGLLNQPNACAQPETDCTKTDKFCRMVGHWLYHGCQHGIEVLTEVVRSIFEGMMYSDSSQCANIFKGKTARDLFEPAYDKDTERTYGNDVTHCNFTKVRIDTDKAYNKYVLQYFHKRNVTREDFYHKMACKRYHLNLSQCDIWPIPTTPKTTTALATTPTTTALIVVPVVQEAALVAIKPRQQFSGRRKTTTPKDMLFEDENNGDGDSGNSPLVRTTQMTSSPARRTRGNPNRKTTKKFNEYDGSGSSNSVIQSLDKRLFFGAFSTAVVLSLFF